MRLVDFLVQILTAHAETLANLQDAFGEEVVVAILERANEKDEHYPLFPENVAWLSPPRLQTDESPYDEIEIAVRSLKLTERLTFYLWTYPIYRQHIESPLDLNGVLNSVEPIEWVCHHAEEWILSLGLPDPFQRIAQQAAEQPWARFRAYCYHMQGNPVVVQTSE